MFCIVCGAKEDEVMKLFCFPRNEERSQKWQSHLGMKYRGVFSGSVRICNRHFTQECFVPGTNPIRLRPDALPTLLPFLLTESVESGPSTSKESQHMPSPSDDIIISEPSTSKETQHMPSPSDDIVITEPAVSQNFPLLQAINIDDPQPSALQKTPTTGTPDVQQATCSSRQHRVRKSLLKDFDAICSGDVTPRKKALMGIVKKKHTQLRRLQKKCKRRGKSLSYLQNIDKSPEMCDVFKNMSPAAINLLVGQIRCSKRSPQGRRWSLDQKVTALALFKRSPKCYALLRRLLILPSKGTLQKLLQKVPLTVGINKHLFSHLGECLQGYEENDRLCCLAFDEISIREHIQYNKFTDCIEGVEDFGNGNRTENLARYALVFLAQGIVRGWKQPVAYYFSRNGISAEKLRSIIHDILIAMSEANIPVIATVCDMGTSNVKALKDMGCTLEKPYFMFCDRKIYSIFDIPHLLKCLRNLFRKYSILVPTMVVEDSAQILEAKWEDIIKAYEEDKKNPLIFRSLHKIKDYYLSPLGQAAMKVKIAAQTLSRSVSVYLFNLIRQGLLPPRALATATLLNEVDAMFDSLNGSNKSPPDGKPFRCTVTENSGHSDFWEECKHKVAHWRYIRKAADISSTTPWKPPSQQGWLHSLQAFIEVWGLLKTMHVAYLNPRHLNQDALENLFGSIRANCGNNENPTVSQFESSLKTQIINGLTHQALEGANCEDDQLNLLSSLRSFINVPDTDESESTTESNIPSFSGSSEIETQVRNMVSIGSIESLSVAYVSGYILKRLFKHLNCKVCFEDLSSDDLQPFNQFISLKEFSDTNNKLYYPSEKLTVTVGYGITILEKQLLFLRKVTNVKKKATDILSTTLDFTFLSCTDHFDYVTKNIIEGICSIGVPWYCTRIVRDLRSQATQKRIERKQRKLQHM